MLNLTVHVSEKFPTSVYLVPQLPSSKCTTMLPSILHGEQYPISLLKVVNDAAECTVKFSCDCTDAITKNEARRQTILQEVELSRKSYPKSTKQCFIQHFHEKATILSYKSLASNLLYFLFAAAMIIILVK